MISRFGNPLCPHRLVNDTFAEGKLGLLGSVFCQERVATVNSVTFDGYLPNMSVGRSASPPFTDLYAPRNFNVNTVKDDRSRLGLTLVGQYRPPGALTLTVDGPYARSVAS
ncbi:hypothetical protein ACN2C6_19495 (plasmid) [Caulobacter sp. ErkDOM-YI]|uniref:hypothetical protein n=1 Tax=unclassified Caulobacter TaxID=2648921 RepID=UPI003AF63B2F